MRDPLAVAVGAAEAAGRLLASRFGRIRRVRYKGATDIVTEADGASERLIRALIARAFPADAVLGEEGGGPGDLAAPGRLWVVDPLDGTVNFAHGYPVFSVSIALVEDGRPLVGVVHDPTRGETFAAARGGGARLDGRRIRVSPRSRLIESLLSTGFSYQRGRALDLSLRRFARFHHTTRAVRRPGSAAIDLAYVAAGRFDGFWETGLKPWDVAAGWLIVEEAGGRVTDYAGKPYRLGQPDILASNRRLHGAMARTVRRPAP